MATAASPSTPVAELLKMRPAELDALFGRSTAGPIPEGSARGTAIIGPGTPLGSVLALVARATIWQGKVFDPVKGELRNKVAPRGIPVKAVRAKVYKDASWYDGQEAIILDYSGTSRVAHWIRDEIRTVGPSTYLGLVYWGRKRLIHFALEFPG
jgi:hypothetical protein